jgi:general secretion pathway protein D
MSLHGRNIARGVTKWQKAAVRECSPRRGRFLCEPMMCRTWTTLIVGASVLVPVAASAQPQAHRPATPLPAATEEPPAPSPSPPADVTFEHDPRRPDELVTLSLENAGLPELVRTMSEMTGRRFVVAVTPKTFQATVVAPQRVTVAEAYQAFLSVLAANHLTVVPRGRFLKIVDSQDAVHEAPVRSTREGVAPEERYVTYIHRLAHVSAEEVSSGVLSKLATHDGAVIPYGNVILLTDTGPSVQRMMRVLDEIDVAQPQDKVWLEPLQYVPAADVKKELDELIDPKGPDKDKPRGSSAAGAGARITRLVALDRPNALLVVGSEGGYERLLELVRSIDVAAPNDGQMHVVMLEHADAKKLVGPINDAVTAAAQPAPSGASGTGQGAGNARVLEAMVKVSAEETNNALIVTASAHDFAAVREVIRRLDQPRRQVYIEAVVMDLSVQRTTAIQSALHGLGDVTGGLGNGSTIFGGNNPMSSLLLPTDASSLQALVLGVKGPSVPVPSFLQGTLGTTSIPGFGFFLDAYAITNDADILSTPHILATDNTPAEIHVQLNTSLQRNAASYGTPGLGTGTSSGAASALGSLSMFSAPASQNYGKIGPKIKVTPHIDESDEVRLDVEETISDLTGDPPQGTLGTINYTERGATTTLTVKDRHTAVIGGLVRDKVTHYATKVPLLGDIPVLGFLFRSSNDVVEKDNLVLVLTPHIIRNEDDMREIFEQRMQERQEFIDHYFVFRERPVGIFEPTHGHGLLAELRASCADAAERRRLEAMPPPTLVAAHPPRAPLDLPEGQGGGGSETGVTARQASPPNVSPVPAQRTVERVEK